MRDLLAVGRVFAANQVNAVIAISLGISPDGRLHIAYDHHGHMLRYRMGVAPGEIEFGPEVPMTGRREDRVTYPQFHCAPYGRFYFIYRDGE